MKKYLLVLGCVFSAMLLLTGCSKKTDIESSVQERANSNVPEVVNMIVVDYAGSEESITAERQAELAAFDYDEWEKFQTELKAKEEPLKFKNQNVYLKALDSYNKCFADCGKITDIGKLEISASKEGYEVVIPFNAENRSGKMAVSYDETLTITNVAFNPDYTIGENLEKAALNTLMGMGTVFSVLILISLIISLFGLIPKIQKSMAASKENKNKTANDSVDNTIAQIIEKEENELSDDLELVAVISAAIAVYEGSTSTEGIVVKSIKKSKKWRNAQF